MNWKDTLKPTKGGVKKLQLMQAHANSPALLMRNLEDARQSFPEPKFQMRLLEQFVSKFLFQAL